MSSNGDQERPQTRAQTLRKTTEQVAIQFHVLDRTIEELDRLISFNDYDGVISRHKVFVSHYEQFIEIVPTLKGLTDADHTEEIVSQETFLSAAKARFESYFSNNPPLATESRSVRAPSIAESEKRRLYEIQHHAELQVEMDTLARERELEERERAIQHERNRMHLEAEIRKSAARIQALSDDGGSFKSAKSDSSAAMLTSVVRTLRKPTFDVEKFDGNPMKYTRFMRDFATNILSFCDTDSERMSSLTQYTCGEARRVVLGFTHLNDSHAYKTAMQKLRDRYGDKELIAHMYVQKALDWPTIKHSDPKGLDQYATFLAEIYSATQDADVQQVSVLEYSENMKRLVYKLPTHLHSKWLSFVRIMKDTQ